jgi:alpha-D-xyloside xylohydrolase
MMKLQVFSPTVIRVAYSLTHSIPTNSLTVIASSTNSGWTLSQNASDIRLTTSALEVRVNRSAGTVGFYDTNGVSLLAEQAGGGKTLVPTTLTTLNGLDESSYVLKQSFELGDGEALAGLGQFHNDGVMNRVGQTRVLQQENQDAVIPVLLSSKGYALLWDSAAITTVDVASSTSNRVSWSSEAGDAVDYYFCYGPDPDQAIAGYRHLTGAPPLFGKWAWGFWQCRERYRTQAELLDIVNTYRSMGVPLDGIIQDWQYWPALNDATAQAGWGSHEFDAARYPDPQAMVDAVHATNVHIIISVWPKFDVTSGGTSIPNLQDLEAVDGALDPVIPYVFPAGQGKWFDPFQPAGRQVYWQGLSDHLFSLGIDGWWLDGSEPELSGSWGELREFDTALGAGSKVHNAYSLMQTVGVYEGQRAENPDKRVFILTRSGFAGQQRNGAVTWSGDIGGNWDVFAKQIPAGLNFTAAGVPYWNTDIGGFFGGQPTDPGYAELFTRWFQYGAFCPMFRVHASTGGNDNYAVEIWRFPAATQTRLIDFVHLRYHLIPYIYSVSWMVTDEGYTMMRPLMMDFPADSTVHGITDQYMFGPALMACPVTSPGATSRSVYLPTGTAWYDFWTGTSYAGGQTISVSAPIEKMPLFVRAGSILPYGPEIQYAAESVDPMDIRVYCGADGSFTLYEDENDNYNYESGSYATIPFAWNESAQTLTIGARQGSFPGMLSNRTFRVVWVGAGHGTGIANTGAADETVNYTGSEVVVSPNP